MSDRQHHLVVIVAAHAIAIAVGLLAPSAIAAFSPEPAYASHNCTRYAPFSYQPNVECYRYEPMDPCCVEGWKTNGFAQRDFQTIAIGGVSRPLFLKLDGNGWSFAWAEGWGTAMSDHRTTGLQARAYCTMDGGGLTDGRCTVWWD